MADSLMLAEKKKQLHAKLQVYRSLPEYILDGVGSVIERPLNPTEAKKRSTFLPTDASHQEAEGFPSYWLNGIVIGSITLLIGWLISLIQGRPFSLDERYLVLWSAATGMLALIANKVNIRAFLNMFRDSALDKMLRETDVEHLGNWLQSNFGLWKPLISGLVVGPGLAWLLYDSWLRNHTDATFHAGFLPSSF